MNSSDEISHDFDREESIPFAWWELDLSTKSVRVSATKLSELGLDPKNVRTYEDVLALVHPEDIESTIESMRSYLRGDNEGYDAVFRVMTASGNYHTFQTTGRVTIRNSAGDPQTLHGTIVELTKSSAPQVTRKLTDHGFIAMFRMHQAVILLVEPKTGRLVDANPSAVAFYGYSREKLLSMTIYHLNILTKEEIQAEILKVKGYQSHIFQFPHRLASGAVRTVEVQSSPIEFAGMRLLFSIIHDITDRNRMISLLTQAEDIARLGHFEIDFNTMLVRSSAGARKIYGFTEELVPLSEVQSLVVADDRTAMDKALSLLLESGSGYDIKFRINKRPSMQVVWLHSVARFEKVERRMIGTIQEITEQKTSENLMSNLISELKTSLGERERFIHILAHDLRSPLSALRELSHLLVENIDTMTSSDHLAALIEVKNASASVYKLLENLLTWASIRGGSICLETTWINVDSLIADIIDLEGTSARRKNIQLVGIPGGIRLKSDLQMLHTVLRNLVSNAIKFTPRGGQIELSTEKNANGNFVVAVKDNGIGIEGSICEKLFRVDQKVSRLGTEKEPGTGLGLLICHELVQQCGGSIEVESEVGKGTTFRVILNSDLNLGHE